jgi:uncharacterized membrane protein
MTRRLQPELLRLLQAILLLNLLSLGMLGGRILATGTFRHGYILWNLVLAWIPLGLALVLRDSLKKTPWPLWPNGLYAALWVIFLPNTWYVLSDYIHVFPTGEVSQLFDIILISTLVFSGFTLGFTSVYLVHRELLRKMKARSAHQIIAAVFLISSFAIYLGRDLRWNTWDVITNPAGLILDVSDRIIDPLGHPRSITVTGLFFMLIGVMYIGIYRTLQINKSPRRR